MGYGSRGRIKKPRRIAGAVVVCLIGTSPFIASVDQLVINILNVFNPAPFYFREVYGFGIITV